MVRFIFWSENVMTSSFLDYTLIITYGKRLTNVKSVWYLQIWQNSRRLKLILISFNPRKRKSTRYYFLCILLHLYYLLNTSCIACIFILYDFENLSNYFQGVLQIDIIKYKVAKLIQGIVTVQSIVVNVII